jgi:hypothetical protein
MILREDKKFWFLLDLSGAVTLMRRDDFAYVWIPRGDEARSLTDEIKAAHAADPSGAAVLAIYGRFHDRFQPLEPSTFLPSEIFFRGGGDRFAADEVTEVRVYPRGSGDFAISIAGPRSWIEATTASSPDEAHRLGVALSTRFKAELIDLNAMYHSPWVEQVMAGQTYKGFSSWLHDELGGMSQAEPGDFSYQGWIMWDSEADRPWWAPMGEVDPVLDLNAYPTAAACRASDPELEDQEFAQPTRIRIARATGAIQVIYDNGAISQELSRQKYYDSFGMKFPSGPEVADETPSP